MQATRDHKYKYQQIYSISVNMTFAYVLIVSDELEFILESILRMLLDLLLDNA